MNVTATPRGRRIAGLVTACTLALAIAPACERSPSPPSGAGAPAPASAAHDSAPSPTARATPAPDAAARPTTAYTASVDELARYITFHEQRAAQRADNWIDLEMAASGYLDRAKLTGDYEDYQRAQDTLARAFTIAPQGAGPFLVRASLHYALHRLPQAAQDLTAVERAAVLPGDTRSQVRALRADIAFHSGRYAEALAGYEAGLREQRTLSGLIALAQYRWKTGDFNAAIPLLDEAQTTIIGPANSTRAFLSFVRGLLELDRGRYDAALMRYREGERHFPGWWLLEEHIAEAHTLTGRADLAIPMYRSLIERTNDPEFMDALAEIYQDRGDEASARPLLERANALFESRLTRFPEASYGHALEHFLRHGDPARAVTIAERNRDARPGGEAYTKLAQAYLHANRANDARTAIEHALGTVWNTAELHGTAALVYEALHDTARANTERTRATAINPHVFEDLAWLAPAQSPRDH